MATLVPRRDSVGPTAERAAAPVPTTLAGALRRLAARFERGRRRARARRDLDALNSRLLRDIGLERPEVADPGYWRRW